MCTGRARRSRAARITHSSRISLPRSPRPRRNGVVSKARPLGLNRLGQNAVPAFPVRMSDELVGFRRITGAQVDVVPLELLPAPVGHVAKVVRLGDPTGIQEVRTG